jgi:uncharacterized lipoprotein YajG
MKLNRRLAAVLAILALVGCAQGPTSQAQAPDAPYSRDSGADKAEAEDD